MYEPETGVVYGRKVAAYMILCRQYCREHGNALGPLFWVFGGWLSFVLLEEQPCPSVRRPRDVNKPEHCCGCLATRRFFGLGFLS